MKKLLTKFTIIFLSTFVVAPLSAFSITPDHIFYDVNEDQTYRTAIEFLYREGIVNGYPDSTFKPQNTLNRAEMLKIIVESTHKPVFPKDIAAFNAYGEQSCFYDVPKGQWFTKYICYGKEKGLVRGYDNGKYFRPSQTVSFVEGLKITLKGFETPFLEGEIWYKNLVETASAQNLIPQTIKAFHDGLRRDEMAELITRILKNNSNQLSEYLGRLADINISYETIENAYDLSELTVEVICAEGTSC